MKRFIAIVMAAMLILSFSGCSIVKDFKEGFAEGFEDGLKSTIQQSGKGYTHGVVEGNVYTSEMTGLTFTAPDGWSFRTDEELMELMDGVYDEEVEDAFTNAAAKMNTVTEMMAIDDNSGTNVIIVYENLLLTGNSGISEEEYFELAKTYGSFEGLAIFDELESVTLSGKDCKYVQINNEGITQYYYMMALEDYMCIIVATNAGDTTRSEIESMFG
ncbi:MAG: hypothetical protein Q4D44_04360 [Eubacteriales bacterium]|nr:hypothetical protein [Eubacteriales bacterium]